MTDYDGTIYTIPDLLEGDVNYDAGQFVTPTALIGGVVDGIDVESYVLPYPALISGTTGTDGETFGTGGGAAPPPTIHYALGAFDNLGNQYHWVNTVVSLDSPPAPVPAGTYVASTLVVEGRF